MKERRSFSLLELIITLGILAVVSTMLLDNFADVKARQCSQVSRERGEQVRSVILGEDGHHGIGGFLSDMGRLPTIYVPSAADGGDGDGGRRLAELYDGSIWHATDTDTALSHVETITPEDVQRIVTSPANDTFPTTGTALYYPEISMSVGWRGPYLPHSNPVGGSFYDGWGRGWKIISNYNVKTNGNHLEENWTGTSHIDIWGTATNAITASTHHPISGIMTFGGNDADDRNATEVEPVNEDQVFLFPHHQDNHLQGIAASLDIELKVREEGTGTWKSLPPIAPWTNSERSSYVRGEVVVQGNQLYWCKSGHVITSSSTFDGTKGNWVQLTGAPAKGSHGLAAQVYRDQGQYCVKEGGSFQPIGLCVQYPDNISLILAVPVMTGTPYASRVMHLGYYHVFRNLTEENAYGVKPVWRSGTTVTDDVDCVGDTAVPASPLPEYNNRYLVAEDDSKPEWNRYAIKRLMPGQRRLFCITYNSDSGLSLCSDVETIELRPGSNRVTLYLRSR